MRLHTGEKFAKRWGRKVLSKTHEHYITTIDEQFNVSIPRPNGSEFPLPSVSCFFFLFLFLFPALFGLGGDQERKPTILERQRFPDERHHTVTGAPSVGSRPRSTFIHITNHSKLFRPHGISSLCFLLFPCCNRYFGLRLFLDFHFPIVNPRSDSEGNLMHYTRLRLTRDEPLQAPLLSATTQQPDVTQKAEQWTRSEYMGPSQLPIAVVSIVCGTIIILLLAYIVYLQRIRWKDLAIQGRKQLRLFTRREPFQAGIDQLDAIEKALRNDTPPVNVMVNENSNRDAIYRPSTGTGYLLSTTHPSSLSLSSHRMTPQDTVTLSQESFYSQAGTSFVINSRSLPIIQILPAERSSPLGTTHSVSSLPTLLSSPQETRYDQPVTIAFDLHEQRRRPHAHVSSVGEHSPKPSGDGGVLNVRPRGLSTRLIPHENNGINRLSENSRFESALNTPDPSTSSSSSSPTSSSMLHQVLDEFSERLEKIRQSMFRPKGTVTTTLDEIHEDIKQSYGAFLDMVEQGYFDSPTGTPCKEGARRDNSVLIRDSDCKDDVESNAISWYQNLDPDNGVSEEGNEFSTRLLSLLIDDLRHRKSVAVEECSFPSFS